MCGWPFDAVDAHVDEEDTQRFAYGVDTAFLSSTANNNNNDILI